MKAVGCSSEYFGSKLNILNNEIFAIQNVLEGWEEQACIQCTDQNGKKYDLDN